MATRSIAAVGAPSRHRQRVIMKVVLYVVLISGAFVALLPFLYMIANSLKTYGETITRVSALPFAPEFWPKVPQWTNYVEAWQDADFSSYFFNSLIIATVTVSGIYCFDIWPGFINFRVELFFG